MTEPDPLHLDDHTGDELVPLEPDQGFDVDSIPESTDETGRMGQDEKD